MAVAIGTQAQQIVDRLSAIDKAHPAFDPRRAEAAIAEHFRVLGIPPLPVRWVPDLKDGYLAAVSAARSAAVSAAVSAARSAAWSAAWSAAESAAWSAAESAAVSAAVSAAESAARSAAVSAAVSAARSAAWSAAVSAAVDRYVAIWLPFVDASEAGLWVYWILEKEVLCVPRPSLSIVDDRLHSERGPAVSWPSGERYWFWRGIQVPQHVVEAPEKIKRSDITAAANIELRRILIERYGQARYLLDSNAQLMHNDIDGLGHERRLWALPIAGDEPLVMVEVVNSTPEPDGYYKTYHLRVPPTMRTCQQALAWTFGIDNATDYVPVVET